MQKSKLSAARPIYFYHHMEKQLTTHLAPRSFSPTIAICITFTARAYCNCLVLVSIKSNKYLYLLFWFYFSHKCLWSAFKERCLPIKVAIFTSSFSSKILCFATRQNQKNAMEIGYEGAQLTKQGSSYVQTNPGLFVQPNDFFKPQRFSKLFMIPEKVKELVLPRDASWKRQKRPTFGITHSNVHIVSTGTIYMQ